MKSEIYGNVGLAVGLSLFTIGLLFRSYEMGGIFVMSGIFLFGCGLIAAAIGAKK